MHRFLFLLWFWPFALSAQTSGTGNALPAAQPIQPGDSRPSDVSIPLKNLSPPPTTTEITPSAGESPSPAARPSAFGGSTPLNRQAPYNPDAPVDKTNPRAWVWAYALGGFAEKDYRTAVDGLFADFESHLGRKLTPGTKRRVGLKVATGTVGLTTPPALVRAVIAALEARGYQPGELFIMDESESRLRAAGYLPAVPTPGAENFAGVPVDVLESGRYYDPKWNYDSPLPAPDSEAQARARSANDWKIKTTDRLTLLPVPLLLDVDFWINLPVGVDTPDLGLSGALVNASLLAGSNTERFLENPQTGAVAIAEIAAVPELTRGWVFTLLSLEHYQYLGGPLFNSLYTESEPTLLLSPNPVILDELLWKRMNAARSRQSFPRLEQPAYFDYARQLGLGDYRQDHVFMVTLPQTK